MISGRARNLGWKLKGIPGEANAITDVNGVLVGSETLNEPGSVARTGVTTILPLGYSPEARLVCAGIHSLNGNGEM